MTKTEAKIILVDRLDFRIDNATPESGKFFEGEHSIVTLDNIKEVQPEINISAEDFTAYLVTLKSDCVYKVLADVFDKDVIGDSVLEHYPALFDNLISKQMTLMVIDLIITSTRITPVKRITDAVAKKLLYDVSNKNGVEAKYFRELRRVQNKIGGQRKFVSITNG